MEVPGRKNQSRREYNGDNFYKLHIEFAGKNFFVPQQWNFKTFQILEQLSTATKNEKKNRSVGTKK